MGKLLTIAVPSYNVEAYLDRGLSSYADHRFDEVLEVLIVNDGSTDSTAAIAQSYVEAFPLIFTLVSKENGGHGSAVNAGVSRASGKYFRVIDGDDWVDTEGLAKLLTSLSRVDADLVVDEMSRVDMQSGEKTPFPFPEYVKTNRIVDFTDVCNVQDTESYIDIHTLTVRTSLLRENEVRISEGIFYVDYEFIVKSTCFASSVMFLPVNVYQYLVGNAGQSMAAANMVKRFKHHEAVLRELLRFEEESVFERDISAYLETKIDLLINTHLNILLIFDEDRKRGMRRAKEFRSWLKSNHPSHAAKTRSRYLQASALHYLGFDEKRLNKIMGR
ncbi:glycosyltransferase family 2 protein [Adlercreutzia sp. ZJ242]|uniref:glycosyltransferase family 2 protein n=1 Tax=Adlercreutzia sp. ZJ242 TaxID=2709409 RepID=UPI0013ED3E47|nr:glycosyltransferase family 2 protein [Adlercreutzia sp. ZJ242]